MEPPEGFTYSIDDGICIIEHRRTGMGCINIFLSVWLFFWTLGCCLLVWQYLNGGKMENGDPISHWFVAGFLAAWVLVAVSLLYSLFARKRFFLTDEYLRIETQLLVARWTMILPRETISEIIQIKDGGEGEDSFPSWGLRICSESLDSTLFQRVSTALRFGQNFRTRTILSRLPYEHSFGLAKIISKWTGVDAQICKNHLNSEST